MTTTTIEQIGEIFVDRGLLVNRRPFGDGSPGCRQSQVVDNRIGIGFRSMDNQGQVTSVKGNSLATQKGKRHDGDVCSFPRKDRLIHVFACPPIIYHVGD
jgi:hypothetical protein